MAAATFMLDTNLLIAAHARALGAALVTNNLAEFARVAGLRCENWAEPPADA